MPLVFAVIVIICIFVVARDNKKDTDREKANYEAERRETNADKERSVFDSFLRQGLTAEEAYYATQADMVRLGYDPCIPISAYGTDRYGHKIMEGATSFVACASDRFDSEAVKRRKRLLADEGIPQTEENIYRDFPNNKAEYDRELKIQATKHQALRVGTWFTYPGYGTLEVLGYSYASFAEWIGYYRARVIKTGEIVTTIRIGDTKIRVVSNK